MPGPPAAAGAPSAGGRNERAWFAGFALGALALYALSPRTEWGDSLHYALAIESGGVARLFEPGHLLWRPLGWLAWQVARLFQPAARAFEPLSLITLVVSAVGAGLAAVFFRRRLPRLPAAFAAVAYATGYAYWSYATTACGYNACATLGLAGLLLAWPEEDRRPGAGRLAGAAAALALGTLLWLPTLLLVPAVALAAGFERRAERTHFGWARAAGTLAGMLLPPVLVYAVCWHGRGAPGGGGFLPWVQAARHDQPLGLGIVGAARAAYGWTRLVWQPWRVALDPTQRGWARLMCARVWWDWGLWKPAAAWLLLAAAVVAGSLRRPRGGWATWALLAVAALPHGLLALTFKGSDPERWLLPAAPLLVLVLRWALGPAPGRGRTAAVCAALALVPLVGAVDRFGPRGNVENRPQMKLMR
ncbi:MAG TPA: hypothetical protein VMS93_01470, partial [Candidatus Saccharimonadales bacterium]|nr:hypothetical protein [Candidatus Saccharimonadales bacterium]